MKNSITKCQPELLKDWDYIKTKYDPSNVTIGSDKRIHWKCMYVDTNGKEKQKIGQLIIQGVICL
ncbi:zinc-ribbon domain-containing protein [Peribacillus huizhouensis]|uniref:Treble clef zinc finger domain-containing protein n=1 Tax=Peribacillus huizhouensis TaxID=1501239 RepID=A0ABR6CP22_9BACI|nr:hypothetical protein [Peribacillus huizhouensis]